MNFIDRYTLEHREEAVDFLLDKYKSLELDEEGNVIQEFNKGNKKVLLQKNGIGYYVKNNSYKDFEVGEYVTGFEIMSRIKFNGVFEQSLYYARKKVNTVESPYFRVGPDWFKKITKIGRDGLRRQEIQRFNIREIERDIGKDAVWDLEKFDGFTMEPDNINYKPVVSGLYNRYQKSAIVSEPCYSLDEIPWSKRMIEHIFQGQMAMHGEHKGREMGLMYLQSLWCYPRQVLPILGLVSEERSTGKTTFLNWMTSMFGDNAVTIAPSNIGSGFNSIYADKIFIGIEESKFDKSSTLEKLKQVSTQKYITVNTKYSQEYTTPFYGKLVITSNNKDKFVIIDEQEIRYWVLEIPTIPEGLANHNIEEDLARELPKLCGYLENLPPLNFSYSRMLFTPEEIGTEMLTTVKEESMSGLYHDLSELFDDWFLNNIHVEKVKFTAKDVKDQWFKNDGRVGIRWLVKVIEKELKLGERMKGTRAPWYIGNPGYDGANLPITRGGNRWTMVNPHYNSDAATQNEDDDIPF